MKSNVYTKRCSVDEMIRLGFCKCIRVWQGLINFSLVDASPVAMEKNFVRRVDTNRVALVFERWVDRYTSAAAHGCSCKCREVCLPRTIFRPNLTQRFLSAMFSVDLGGRV